MTSQKVEYLALDKLTLWSENPRDPLSAAASDKDVVDIATSDRRGRWALKKLAEQMGDSYDFSEIPTVVYHGKTPVVYDGNRRVILGKLFNNLVESATPINFPIPNIPLKIPCNVCSKDIALKHVLRKHGESGSWHPLERDIFLHKHMGEPKSNFLILDEATGIISNNPSMNKGFVKDEVFRESNLNDLGFYTDSGELKSKHKKDEVTDILSDLVNKVESKEITTRENRGQVFGVLNPTTKKIIQNNSDKIKRKVGAISSNRTTPTLPKKKRTPIVKVKDLELFGETLSLKSGDVNNLYRDIDTLYKFYKNPKSATSSTFHVLIRMALRLLCEIAAQDHNKSLDQYVRENYDIAKNTLDKDVKTFLANQQVKKESI